MTEKRENMQNQWFFNRNVHEMTRFTAQKNNDILRKRLPGSYNNGEREEEHMSRAYITGDVRAERKRKRALQKKAIVKNYELYLFMLIPFAYIIIFHYVPMYGILMSFQDYMPGLGILGSPWVGFKHFNRFFHSHNFPLVMKNTLLLSIYSIILGFPLPIVLAIMFNEMKQKNLRIVSQTITYAPHFISCVVIVGMIMGFFSNQGLFNQLRSAFGLERIPFMQRPEYFRSIYIGSSLWQETGWGTIIYFAALSGVDEALCESAKIDGANRVQIIWHIHIPAIMPTIVIMLILNMGSILGVGFEKVFLMQNALNTEVSEIISTYVYKMGIQGGSYSFGTAIGLFNSVVNFVLLVLVNAVARSISETSLW